MTGTRDGEPSPARRPRRPRAGRCAVALLAGLLPGLASAQMPARPSPATGAVPGSPRLTGPLELPALPGDPAEAAAPLPVEGPADPRPRGRWINLRPDSSGLMPSRPPGPPEPRPLDEVAGQVDALIDQVIDAEAELVVVVGRSKLIETREPIGRIAIANPTIADVELLADRPQPRAIMLYGLSFGTTNLTIWDANDRPVSFLVRATIDAPDLEERIKTVFPGADVRVKQVGSQILLDGQVTDSKMMSEVLQMVAGELRLGAVQGIGTGSAPPVAPGAPPAGPGPGGGTGGMGGGTLGGAGAASPGSAALAGVVINRVRVPGPKQVLLHVKIAELNRSALRELGVNWLDSRNKQLLGTTVGGVGNITGTAGLSEQNPLSQFGAVRQGTVVGNRISPTVIEPISSIFGSTAFGVNNPLTSQFFGIFDAGQFSLFLNALRQNNLVKILAEPNLVAVDGQPARFLSGGQFPYPVPQTTSGGGTAITIQFAQFGAILEFLPVILPNGVIRLDVQPNFSRLNPLQGVSVLGTTVPGIDERSARTVVELREGQTLALAGLLQTTTEASTIRIPGLGDLPVVGPLFSRNRIQTVETELVVLVTPVLVAPVEACEMPPAPGDLVMEPNDVEFFFLGRIEGKTGRPHRATVHQQDPLQVMKHHRSEAQWVVGPHGHSD